MARRKKRNKASRTFWNQKEMIGTAYETFMKHNRSPVRSPLQHQAYILRKSNESKVAAANFKQFAFNHVTIEFNEKAKEETEF